MLERERVHSRGSGVAVSLPACRTVWYALAAAVVVVLLMYTRRTGFAAHPHPPPERPDSMPALEQLLLPHAGSGGGDHRDSTTTTSAPAVAAAAGAGSGGASGGPVSGGAVQTPEGLLKRVAKALQSQRAEYREQRETLNTLVAQVQALGEQQKQTAAHIDAVSDAQAKAAADIKAAAVAAAAAAAAAAAQSVVQSGAAAAAVTAPAGPKHGVSKTLVNRNAGHWVVETSERVREKFGEMKPLPSSPDDRACAGHATCFFGRCFCEPGWSGADCLTPLSPYNPWYTDCPNIDPAHKGTTPCPPNTIWYTHDSDCHFLCNYHADSGVARTDLKAWKAAQTAEAGVWSGSGPGNDRASEHHQGYAGFKALANRADVQFGDIVEFGCGPWTQTASMLETLGHPESVGTVTLLEPNGARYLREVPGSAYRTGTLNDKYPVVLVSVGGEGFDDGWRFVELFDTVVSMNVIEHVHDAFRYLMNLWLALKPGGTLIFHDRWFDDPIKAQGLLGSFALHPIRINRVLMEHFIAQFEPIYKSTAKTDRMARARMNLSKGEDPGQTVMVDANEQAYYFIGRKPLNATTDFCKLKP